MKKIIVLLLLLFSFAKTSFSEHTTKPNLDHIPRKCKKCEEKENQKIRAIASYIFGIISSLLNILQAAPSDKQSVGTNINGIVASVGSIVATAVKGGAVVQEYVESEEFKEEVKTMVAKKTRRMNI